MDVATLEAIFGNVGSLLCFQVGARDAEALAEQYGGDLTPRDLMNLPKFTGYLRLLINGQPSRPFSMETLRPRSQSSRQAQKAEVVRRTSRRRYGRKATAVKSQMTEVSASV